MGVSSLSFNQSKTAIIKKKLIRALKKLSFNIYNIANNGLLRKKNY